MVGLGLQEAWTYVLELVLILIAPMELYAWFHSKFGLAGGLDLCT